jgi:hypothetical protein
VKDDSAKLNVTMGKDCNFGIKKRIETSCGESRSTIQRKELRCLEITTEANFFDGKSPMWKRLL